jgi:tetraacyldisaccharide-1-P 4'-kinase
VPRGSLHDRLEHVRVWGDEAVMLASLVDGVEVWAGPDRTTTIAAALECQARFVVVDDGLSLESRGKALEIALVSSDQTCLQTLPAGPLRRPVTDTARAHILGIQDCGANGDYEREALRLRRASGAEHLPWFGFRLVPVTTRGDRDVHLAAGIARPERFERAARRAGHRVTGRTWYPDHHVPSRRDLADLDRAAAGARAILVTAKDAPRFPRRIGELPVEALHVRVEVFTGEEWLLESLESLAAGS